MVSQGGLPSRIGLIMGIPTIEIEKVIYFAGYIVASVNEEAKVKMLKELEGEYKVKVKQATDDKTKEAIKDLFQTQRKTSIILQKDKCLMKSNIIIFL